MYGDGVHYHDSDTGRSAMIKIIVIMFILRFIAAVVQPVGDKRYAEAAGIMAETVELMLRACGISVMMFIISIALMSVNIS